MDSGLLIEAYRQMVLIRRMEEWVIEQYAEQNAAFARKETPAHAIRCPTHLSIGQEAAAVGVCMALRPSDVVFSTHRCHAHYIAKGGDLRRMAAELLGRNTGCAQGKGGSMHLTDPSVGMTGSSSIVAGSIPIAAGAALAFKKRGLDSVAVAFFGDAATEEGVFHETMHCAGLWKLPLILACENNFYATLSHISARQVTPIHERAASYGVHGVHVDGNCVEDVFDAAADAVQRARSGNGPTLIVSDTYRWFAHVGPNTDTGKNRRTAEELASWKERCPIKRLRATLESTWEREELDRVESEAAEAVRDAVDEAKRDPEPDSEELLSHV